jgi:hypothetical protein
MFFGSGFGDNMQTLVNSMRLSKHFWKNLSNADAKGCSRLKPWEKASGTRRNLPYVRNFSRIMREIHASREDLHGRRVLPAFPAYGF